MIYQLLIIWSSLAQGPFQSRRKTSTSFSLTSFDFLFDEEVLPADSKMTARPAVCRK